MKLRKGVSDCLLWTGVSGVMKSHGQLLRCLSRVVWMETRTDLNDKRDFTLKSEHRQPQNEVF